MFMVNVDTHCDICHDDTRHVGFPTDFWPVLYFVLLESCYAAVLEVILHGHLCCTCCVHRSCRWVWLLFRLTLRHWALFLNKTAWWNAVDRCIQQSCILSCSVVEKFNNKHLTSILSWFAVAYCCRNISRCL